MKSTLLAVLAAALGMGMVNVANAAHTDVNVSIGAPGPVVVAPAPVVVGWHDDRYWDGHRYWARRDWVMRHCYHHHHHRDCPR